MTADPPEPDRPVTIDPPDPDLPSCTPDGLATLVVRGLTPAFSTRMNAYRVPAPAGGSFELTALACDAGVQVYVQSTPHLPGSIARPWVADGRSVDVVLYRNWREVGRYTIAVDASLPPPAPAPGIVAIRAPGLSPAFAPGITDYTVPYASGDSLPISVEVGDPSWNVFIQSVPVTSGQVRQAWAPRGQVIDVVAYRNWVELTRYRVRVAAEWDGWTRFESLPEGATEVSGTELARLLAAGRLDPIVDVPAASTAISDAAILERHFQQHPDRRAAFEALVASLGADGDRPTRTVTLTDKRGILREIEANGLARYTHELARAIATSEDRKNAEGTYRRLFGALPETAQRVLPTPEAAAQLSPEALKSVTRELLRSWQTAFRLSNEALRVEPYGYSAASTTLSFSKPCVGGYSGVIGEADGGDLQALEPTDVTKCVLSPDGIVANDTRPYTKRLSCIRDQANRGSCAGFALSSALESAYYQRTQMHVNLSEQSLYGKGKRLEPVEDQNGQMWDGLSPGDTLERFAAKPFFASFENGWQYNPSPKRKKLGNGAYFKYEKSCDGYAENCSDAPHQAKRICVRGSLGGRLGLACAWEVQTTDFGIGVTAAGLELWDGPNAGDSMDLMRAALDAGDELVISVMVNDSFKAAAASDGFIRYDGEGESNWGAHALHVVGYIGNTDLAKLAPSAPKGDVGPPGTSGEGGYFIARNSWGPCVGDGGYLYLPYRWMRPAYFVASVRTISSEDVHLGVTH